MWEEGNADQKMGRSCDGEEEGAFLFYVEFDNLKIKTMPLTSARRLLEVRRFLSDRRTSGQEEDIFTKDEEVPAMEDEVPIKEDGVPA